MQAFSAQEYKVQMIKTERKNSAAKDDLTKDDLTKATEQLQGTTIQENVSGSLTIYWSYILVVSCTGTDKWYCTPHRENAGYIYMYVL